MKIKLDNLDCDPESALIFANYPGAAEAAIDDQVVAGTRWETNGDDFAYAIVCDHPGLLAELEGEGYEVDSSEYCPPDEED